MIRLLCLAVLLTACNGPARAELRIEDGWIAAAPPGASAHAAYARLHNEGSTAVRCERVSSPAFGAAEIHRSQLEAGHHRMLRDQVIEIPAGGSARLEPGALHLMLFRPQVDLAAGAQVHITLDCGSQQASAVFTVRPRP